MKLIYKGTNKVVKIGDIVPTTNGASTVEHFEKPHKPSAEGKVVLKYPNGNSEQFYVGVIGAEWIEREDRVFTKHLDLEPKNDVDRAIIARHAESVRERCKVELAIIRELMDHLSKQCFGLRASNGEDKVIPRQTADEMIEVIFSVDEARLLVEGPRGDREILLILGEDGWDVICDYSGSLCPVLDPFIDWINAEQERHATLVNEKNES